AFAETQRTINTTIKVAKWIFIWILLQKLPSSTEEGSFVYLSAVGAEPPLKSSLPSGSLMERPLATGPPDFARNPVTSTSVPALTVSAFQPRRIRAFGAPSSNR